MNPVAEIDWYQLKLFAERASGMSMDALHVIAGVVLYLGFAMIFRTTVARALPLMAVLVLELINEANDFRVELWPDAGMQAGEAAKDVALTMFLPALIFLIARYRPGILVRHPADGRAAEATLHESGRGAAG